METIWFYAQLGFKHVLDFQGLDHFYFIIALAIPFGFREFKKLLLWVSIFTLGHTLSLFGNYYFELILHLLKNKPKELFSELCKTLMFSK